MLERSAAYAAAISGDDRRVLLKAIVNIIDPDMQPAAPTGTAQAPFSKPEQIEDRNLDSGPAYASLERGAWLLTGNVPILPAAAEEISMQVGYVGAEISGNDGMFQSVQQVQQNFSGVSILQACSVFFPTEEAHGVAADFAVEVLQGGEVYHRVEFSGNTLPAVYLDGFTVYDPDAIRVTVTRWSIPGRRMRVLEIQPGIYEEWSNDIIAEFDVRQEANFSCLALPYGTCTLRMDNLDRRFEPRNKEGVFKSIEERQGIDVSVGVTLEDGATEYKHVGVFYQYSGGWKTGDNGLSMQWDLADIVGLLANRTFVLPENIPTTLNGWFAALAAQLGKNFERRYHVDPAYADLPVVGNVEDLRGVSCGDVMRWACMVTGTWPRADAETGFLTAEPFWSQGNKLDLDNMTAYPVMRANDDIAAIVFTLYDGADTQYMVSGNATASSNTVSVSNPFIHDKETALKAARMILSAYGGNQLDTIGRGDPASEIGDVDTVWLNESGATTGRRMRQSLRMQEGVLQGCEATLLQADGSFMFQSRAVLTGSGEWTAPAGVNRLRLVLVGKGEDGEDGTDGSWTEAGKDGADGEGALVWSGTIETNPEQTFSYACADETVFGSHTSAQGARYPLGYTDVASGDSFARSGVSEPQPGTGDGGCGGYGGVKGNKHTEIRKDYTVGGTLPGNTSGVYLPVSVLVVDNHPGPGGPGIKGATGCAVVYWDKEAEA